MGPVNVVSVDRRIVQDPKTKVVTEVWRVCFSDGTAKYAKDLGTMVCRILNQGGQHEAVPGHKTKEVAG